MKKEIEGLEYEEMKEEVEKLPESAEEEQAHSVGDSASYTPEMRICKLRDRDQDKTKHRCGYEQRNEGIAIQGDQKRSGLKNLQKHSKTLRNNKKIKCNRRNF